MQNSKVTGKDRLIKEQEKKREAAIKGLDKPTEPGDATPSTPPQDPPRQAQPPAEPKPDTSGEPPAPPEGDTRKGNGKADDTESGKPDRKAIDHSGGGHDPATEVALWKQRYETVQGKYNAELPRLQQQVKDLESENAELKAKAEQLETGNAPNQMLSKAQKSEYYQRLVREYDEDTAKDIAGLLADMTQGLQPPEPQASPEPPPVDALNSHEEFRIVLNSEVPGWENKYDRNDAFIDWAESTEDPHSGETMLQVLNRAALETFDTKVARRIFSAFDRQVSKHPGANSRGDNFVEPAGDGGEGKPPPEAPTYKSGDLKHMQDLLRRNKITRERFDKFQADFVKAQNEGRITPG